jgi:hypothetical protein
MVYHISLFSEEDRVSALPPARALAKGFAAFAVVGLGMAAMLRGTMLPWNGLAGAPEPSVAVAVSHAPLDLTKPIFVEGELCPDEGLLSLYSDADSKGCLVADSTRPVTIVASATNGLQAQVFKVDMDTSQGMVEGWVAANFLRN